MAIVSDAAAKIIGPCPKKPKMDNIQIIDEPYNPPQDLVIDMNAIVADLLNNLLPTKIEDSSNKSNVNKQPQNLALRIDEDGSGSDVIDEGEDPPTEQNIPRRHEYVFYPPDELHQRRCGWTRFGSYEMYGITSNTKCTRILHKICWLQSFPSRQIYCITFIMLMARGW